MHPADAVDQAFTSRPEDIRSLLRALPAQHFHPVRDDEASQGQPALKRALEGYDRRPHGSAEPLSDSPGGLHVHAYWEFWVLNGVLHPADGVADPTSPVVLYNRCPQAEIGYLLLYGPSVLELAVRVLGYGLAWWALRGTPPEPTTYPRAFDFGSWN